MSASVTPSALGHDLLVDTSGLDAAVVMLPTEKEKRDGFGEGLRCPVPAAAIREESPRSALEKVSYRESCSLP